MERSSFCQWKRCQVSFSDDVLEVIGETTVQDA